MTMPLSGPITLSQANVELGLHSSGTVSLGSPAVHLLANGAEGSSTVTTQMLYGKKTKLAYPLLAGQSAFQTGFSRNAFGSPLTLPDFQASPGTYITSLATDKNQNFLELILNTGVASNFIFGVLIVEPNGSTHRYTASAATFSSSPFPQWVWSTTFKFIVSDNYRIYVV